MKLKISDIEKAIGLALKVHNGQKDKAGAPYILHPLRVVLSMDTDTDRQAAVLHDVIEDGDITPKFLRLEGFSEEVCYAVVVLTKGPRESYDEYLNRVNENPISRRVKLADLNDNMDQNRIKEPTKKDRERFGKYRKAWELLIEKKKFKVYVDENFHSHDESERYLKGNYNDCLTAVNVCKQIVDDFLKKAYEEGKTGSQLWREYTQWGEDPFIVVAEGEKDCSFSAWDYARERIKEIAELQ